MRSLSRARRKKNKGPRRVSDMDPKGSMLRDVQDVHEGRRFELILGKMEYDGFRGL